MSLTQTGKVRVLLGLVVLATLAMFLVPPIAQDPAYHRFADQRTWLGISNGANVLSNLPFLVVGLLGLREIATAPPGMIAEFRTGYRIFFAGIAAIGLGSAYYHHNPNHATLVWDRLPMTVAFMALVAIVVAEHISLTWGRRLLWPLEAIGVLSVFYWHITELNGHGDLRLYGLVQFLPMLLVPIVLLWFPSRFTRTGYLWGLLAGYGLAKLAEMADQPIADALGGISGHTVKHLLAAGAAYVFFLAIRERRPLGIPSLWR